MKPTLSYRAVRAALADAEVLTDVLPLGMALLGGGHVRRLPADWSRPFQAKDFRFVERRTAVVARADDGRSALLVPDDRQLDNASAS